jgi:hypothetical protein
MRGVLVKRAKESHKRDMLPLGAGQEIHPHHPRTSYSSFSTPHHIISLQIFSESPLSPAVPILFSHPLDGFLLWPLL